MWFTYVLKSRKTGKFYAGYTSDVERRLLYHNAKLGGAFTSRNAPFDLVYYEAFLSKNDAMREEKFLKSGKGREFFREKIKCSLKIIDENQVSPP